MEEKNAPATEENESNNDQNNTTATNNIIEAVTNRILRQNPHCINTTNQVEISI